MTTYDLIVLGGGRAATLATAAGEAGRRVALVERDRLGGTCPNTGCVPSKLLIGFAEASRHVREADRHFVDAEWRSANWRRMFAVTNEYIAGVDPRYADRLPDTVDLYRGHGRFVADKVIEVEGRRLTAETIVVATGTRPREVPFPDLPVWTSDALFPLREEPPASVLVVGGGFVGCELAAFFTGIGVDAELVVRGDGLLTGEDEDIARVFRDEFTRHVPTRFATEVAALRHDGTRFHAELARADGKREGRAVDAVLFAIGRVPNTDDLGLEHTGIERDERGFLVNDDHLETTVPGVYAAGDVAGRWVFQHAATFDVQYLREKLVKGSEGPIDYAPMPHAVYSEPEVASVGSTERQLVEAGTPHVAVLRDWQASARAMAMRLDYPRIKLLVGTEDYRILGCHLVGPHASTLIHEVLPVMRVANDVRVLVDTIHIHPALSEVVFAAAVKAASAVRKRRSD